MHVSCIFYVDWELEGAERVGIIYFFSKNEGKVTGNEQLVLGLMLNFLGDDLTRCMSS